LSNYLITGGSKGVGKELYNQLAKNGHAVYIWDIEKPTWEIKKSLFTKIDCSLDNKIKKLSKDFSKKKILFDGLIFCHGAHHSAHCSLKLTLLAL
jgi:short-subunit dehydrogenase